MKLPMERLERVEAWGMSSWSLAYVYRPVFAEEIVRAFSEARAANKTVAFAGGRNSYGDAFQNSENVVIDFSRMTRVLDYDKQNGIIVCEPGVTIRDLWRYVIEDGWWPPVVSGTGLVTLGGAVAANIHGKNNLRAGPIGEHVLSFNLLLPSGDKVACDPIEEPELFYGAIGGFGLLGAITSITLRLRRVFSGMLDVKVISADSFEIMFRLFEEHAVDHDYIVGWIDGFASGSHCGRGVVHVADYVAEDADPHPEETLHIAKQSEPEAFAGWIARAKVWRLMRPFVRPVGMRIVNSLKYWSGKREDGKRYQQTIPEFNFLLDFVPNWKWSYRPGALIQYQPFIPKETARQAFERILTLSQDRGIVPYLCVLKRHRPDSFLLSHAVDGYSLALDYHVTSKNRGRVWDLIRALDEVVLESGGRFYFAKDCTLTAGTTRSYLGDEKYQQFVQLKRKVDPELLLQSNLSRRVFAFGDDIGP